MREWRKASDKEIENMTLVEALDIIQKHIDKGVFAIEHPDQAAWCPRKHMTKALQIVVGNHQKLFMALGRSIKREMKYSRQVSSLVGYLDRAITEMIHDHYGDPSIVYEILNEADKYMKEEFADERPRKNRQDM